MTNARTISDSPTTVNVATFRMAIRQMEQIVNVDRHACVGADEKARWVAIARHTGSGLMDLTCKRATADDMMRYERIIDASTDAIARFTGLI